MLVVGGMKGNKSHKTSSKNSSFVLQIFINRFGNNNYLSGVVQPTEFALISNVGTSTFYKQQQ